MLTFRGLDLLPALLPLLPPLHQGDDGDFFYVVEEGDYHALINVKGGDMKKVFEYKGEGNFGELALLYNQPRAATIEVSRRQTDI